MEQLIIRTEREGYSTSQVESTMTVGELIRFLEDCDEDMPVYLSFDNGYTYGGLHESRMEAEYVSEEE